MDPYSISIIRINTQTPAAEQNYAASEDFYFELRRFLARENGILARKGMKAELVELDFGIDQDLYDALVAMPAHGR